MTPESFLALTERNADPAFLLSSHGTVVAANPSGSSTLGCTAVSPDCGMDLGDFVDDSEGAFEAHLRSWVASGVPISRPIRLKDPDGRRRRYRGEGLRVTSPGPQVDPLVLLHCVPLDARAERRSTLAPQRSASEGKEPRTVGKMEAMGNLAAGIAHDFNNLLTVMKVEVELAMEHDEVPAEIVDSLLSTHAAVLRAESLVDGLLAFSRHQLVRTSRTDLRRLVEGTIPRVHTITDPAEPVVDQADAPLPVQIDPEHMETVLLALVRNAVEATTAEPFVSIRTRREVLGPDFVRRNAGSSEGEFAVLEVADRGTGIPPEVAARMFEPFFTTKGRGYGRGLGLAQAFGIVKMLGGYVKVDTDLGVGSTFTVYLPLQGDLQGDPERTEDA
ncbi:MAG: ATP-binding protein [Gemmatimonadota bacterium]|nr:ATP-binding protein [Gemmatimonadota bacterium]